MIPFVPTLDWNTLKSHLTGDLRERYEMRINPGNTDSLNDRRVDLTSRIRIGTSFEGKNYKASLTYQYAHDLIWSQQRNYSMQRSDVYTAYVDVDNYRLGRQTYSVGNERLIGAADWGLTGRTWNAAKGTFGDLTAFAGQMAVNPNTNNTVRLVTLQHSKLNGLYSFKHDGRSRSDIHMLSATHDFNLGDGLKLSIEAAGQRGSVSGTEQEAWMGVISADAKVLPKVSVVAEAILASGGTSNGKINTFDPFYPSPHDKYGLMDIQGLSNTNTYGVSINFDLGKSASAKFEYHKIALRDASDAWYSSTGINKIGSSIFLDSTGASGKDVGEEVDFVYRKELSNKAAIQLGWGILTPGAFVKSFTAGTAANQSYGYIQYRQKF